MVDSATTSAGVEYDLLAWALTSPLLAVSSHSKDGSGQLHFLHNNASSSEREVCVRPSRITQFAWCPTEELLAVAWADGLLSLFTPIEKKCDIDTSSVLSALLWSVSGDHLLTVYQNGEYCLFSRGSLGKPRKRPKAKCEEVAKTAIALSEGGEVSAFGGGSHFLLGGATRGFLFLIQQDETITRIFDTSAPIEALFELKEKEFVIVFSADLSLRILTLTSPNSATEMRKVKLTGKLENIRLALCDALLVICNREKEIRVWDIRNDENLSLPLNASGFSATDIPSCVAARRGVICAGTTDGKVATWRRRKVPTNSESNWTLQSADKIANKIVSLSWSPAALVLAVNSGSEVILLHDDTVYAHFRAKLAAIQSTPSSFCLINSTTGAFQELRLPFQAKGIFLGDKQLVVWSSDTSSLASFPSTSFACSALEVALVLQTVLTLEHDKLNLRTLQGTVKQQITVPEMEGEPCRMHLNRTWLCLATTNNFIRVYDLSKREARQQYLSKSLQLEEGMNLHQTRINVLGTRVAVSCGQGSRPPDCVAVWDAESDVMSLFSFKTGMTDEQQREEEAERANTHSSLRPVTAAARRIERERSRFCLPSHHTGSIEWDESDGRFMVVEALPDGADSLHSEAFVLTALATTEHGLLPHALQPLSQNTARLIGCAVPNIYFLKNRESEEENRSTDRVVAKLLLVRTLQEFAGLEEADATTREAMLNFCLFLTLGRIDDAFKAIKFIKSSLVWQQLASMSVKARRLDVAMVCLGHMGHATAAAALRRATARGENDAMKCALLGAHLGMLEEAESLYISCGRYDKVTKMLTARNHWDHALASALQHDRIHIKRVHYEWAKYLEDGGDVDGAIAQYEQSGCHQQEIPRMLAGERQKMLESYIRRRRESKELQRWWASFLESVGETDGAINFYSVAEDIHSMVRIRHQQGHFDEALRMAEESGDAAACLEMARVSEQTGRLDDAVNLYTKANAISSAIRLAMEHSMADRLATLCLMAGVQQMANGAAFYEDLPGHAQTAVMLYHKAGMVGKALDVAYRTEQYSALDLVTKELSASSEPATLQRAAEFFTKNGNFEKAAELLAMANKVPEAIQLCEERNVRMTDTITELLTPKKEVYPDASTRRALLSQVGELCLSQGAFQAAAKKFAQAGDMQNAMRSLIRSGDVARVVYFATTARSREVYVLAGNFLQTRPWRGDAALIRNIETFYSRAGAFEHLANFYISCAYMELEDYADIEKALNALEEAGKSAKKAKQPGELEQMIAGYVTETQRLIKLKSGLQVDATDGLRQLRSLESRPGEMVESPKAIATIARALASAGNFSEAWSCITEIRRRNASTSLSRLLPREVLDQVADAVGQPRLAVSEGEGVESDEEGLEQVDFSHSLQRAAAAAGK